MTNYAGAGWGRWAAYHLCVVDEKGAVFDPLVIEADEIEGIWMAECDIDKLRRS